MISIKKPSEIEKMRLANRIVMQAHFEIAKHIKNGISTLELDRIAEEVILSKSAKPNFKGYRGFKHTACVSINDEVIHGIPKVDRLLKNGDIVSVDLGCVYQGYHGDAARTYGVGKITNEASLLIQAAKDAFFAAAGQCYAGRRLGDIGHAVQSVAEKRGYSIAKNYTGHGIGRRLHEDPIVQNTGKPMTGTALKAGYTLAIEPMINQGKSDIYVATDKWTVKTKDGKLSAHYENVVLITGSNPEILE